MALGKHAWAAYTDPFRSTWNRDAAEHSQAHDHAHDHAHAGENEHGHAHNEFCQHGEGDCDNGGCLRSHEHDHA